MHNEDYLDVGYFSKPHGFKGHLSFHITTENDILYHEIDHVLLDVNKLLTPFFIENIDAKGKLIFKLEQIDNDKEAKKLQSKHVYINKKHIQFVETENKNELIGYKVNDQQFGQIGELIRVEELPSQLIWIVLSGEKEVLLPAEQQFIIEINHENKTIIYNAPEGLISLYLD
jgi:16S rRNA processing protein RimM